MSRDVIAVSDIEARVAELERKIADLDARRREYAFHLDAYRALLSVPAPEERDEPKAPPRPIAKGGAKQLPRREVARMNLTEVVLSDVRQHPGSIPKDVVDRVQHLVGARSGNPRKMLYSYIASLQADGRLRRDGHALAIGAPLRNSKSNGQKPKPKQAIVSLLQDNPGIQATEIIGKLKSRVRAAGDPTMAVRMIIGQMTKSGELRRDDTGGIFLNHR
jgi:hypothetical protein